MSFDSLEDYEKEFDTRFTLDEKSDPNILDILNGNFKDHKSNPKYYVYIGLYYANVERDFVNARPYFIGGANDKCVKSYLYLGILYYTKDKDYINAYLYFKLGAEQKCGLCMCWLGYYCESVLCDDNSAIKWYLKANVCKELHAPYYLANVYEDMGDLDAALEWYHIAINKGISCEFELGRICRKLGSFGDAVKWLKKGIVKGCFDSTHELGDYYVSIEEYDKAKPCFEAVIKHYGVTLIDYNACNPSVKSYFGLGYISEMQGDAKKAIKYYLICNDSNYVKGTYRLGLLYKKLGRPHKAVTYLRIAFDKKYYGALEELVSLYDDNDKKYEEAQNNRKRKSSDVDNNNDNDNDTTCKKK
jgi:tetratricopeptide (TPR) repeat protein